MRNEGEGLSTFPNPSTFHAPQFLSLQPLSLSNPFFEPADLQHCSNAGAPSSLSLFSRRPAGLFESQCRGASSSRTPVSTPLSLSSTLLCQAWSRCSLSHSSIISVLQLSSNASVAVPPLLPVVRSGCVYLTFQNSHCFVLRMLILTALLCIFACILSHFDFINNWVLLLFNYA